MTAAETNKLRRDLKALDKLRTKIEQLAAQDEAASSALIAEFKRHRIDRFNFAPNRAGVLASKTKSSVTPDAFRRAAIEKNLSDEQMDACLKEGVLIGEARKVLGDETVDKIADKKPGKPELRITGQRG